MSTAAEIHEYITHLHGFRVKALQAAAAKISEKAASLAVDSFALDALVDEQAAASVFAQFLRRTEQRQQQHGDTLGDAMKAALDVIVHEQTEGYWPTRSSSQSANLLALTEGGARADFLRDWAKAIRAL